VVEQNIRLVTSIRRPVPEDVGQQRETRLPPDAQVMTPTAPTQQAASQQPDGENKIVSNGGAAEATPASE